MSFEMKAEMKRGINPDSGPGNLALGYPRLHPVLPKTEGRKKANAQGRGTKPPMGCNRGFYLGFLMRFAGEVLGGGTVGNEMLLTHPNEVPKDSVQGSRQIRCGLLEQ